MAVTAHVRVVVAPVALAAVVVAVHVAVIVAVLAIGTAMLGVLAVVAAALPMSMLSQGRRCRRRRPGPASRVRRGSTTAKLRLGRVVAAVLRRAVP